jgi:protein O-GlcNAc transferase
MGKITALVLILVCVSGCPSGPEKQNIFLPLVPEQQEEGHYKKCEKGAISFGLWGDKPKYVNGTIENIKLAETVYPGWRVVVYLDPSTVPADKIKEFENLNAIVRQDPSYNNPFSRFLIADDEQFDCFIVRDTDSRLNFREKAAVDEWVRTKFMMHGMRDHQYHNFYVMGGMWGARQGFLRGAKMSELLKRDQSDKDVYLNDQYFLEWLAKNIVQVENLLTHDSYHCRENPYSFSFPTKRAKERFVGQRVLFDESGIEFYEIIGDKEAPQACQRGHLNG